MPSDSSNTAAAARIALSPVMDRGAVTAHLEEFRSALAAGTAIEICCAEVRQIGQAGLQLLASLLQTGRERDVAVNISGLAAIEPVIRLAGMGPMFLASHASANGGDQ